MRRLLCIALLPLAFAFTSCGLIYTNITEPLDVNLNNTPVFDRKAEGNTKEVRYYVSIEWDSNGIGDIAKQNGLTEVHYADISTLSVLGVWRQRFVRIYGK
ncbi:MAG: TRL domain-containing protein [Planctomycetota bacterium]|jgi:hypothetical protein